MVIFCSKRKNTKVTLSLLGVFVLGGLTGCEMYHESYLSPNRIQIEKSQVNEQIALSELEEPFLDHVARDYAKKGKGPLDLAVTYDPKSKTNTAMKANSEASAIAGVLRRYGVDEMVVSVMPVQDQGAGSQVFVSYDAYDALPPKGCEEMAGMQSRHAESDSNYKLGCTIDTVVTRQLARPKDLMGQEGGDPNTDGRRSARIVEIYRAGSKDEKLEGETASGD